MDGKRVPSWQQIADITCGFKGITNKLDYIQGMGFDAVWISPIVHNIENETAYGEAYHGYAAPGCRFYEYTSEKLLSQILESGPHQTQRSLRRYEQRKRSLSTRTDKVISHAIDSSMCSRKLCTIEGCISSSTLSSIIWLPLHCPLLSVLTRLSTSQLTSTPSASSRTTTIRWVVFFPWIRVEWRALDRCGTMLPWRHQRSSRGSQHGESGCHKLHVFLDQPDRPDVWRRWRSDRHSEAQ